MSVITKIELKLSDKEAIEKAARKVGGKILGEGVYQIYSKLVKGYGIQFPGWKYPVVITEKGNLYYDDGHGLWGNPKYIESFKNEYNKAVIQKEIEKYAKENGYIINNVGNTIKLSKGKEELNIKLEEGKVEIEAFGFTGQACEKEKNKLTQRIDHTLLFERKKPEYFLNNFNENKNFLKNEY